MTRAHDAAQSIVPRQTAPKPATRTRLEECCAANMLLRAEIAAMRNVTGEWTREPPAVAGWYWVRDRIESDDSDIWVRFVNPSDDPCYRTLYTERWSIPIPPPESK